MIKPWDPPIDTSSVEQRILHLCRKQKLWQFLREYRHLLLDEEVRSGLADMYSPTGKGCPVPPEQLALAMLLQVAFGVPDHEVPTLTVVDQRWRMVLGCLDDTSGEPLFSQGTVFHFRERAREHGFIKQLLEKTVTLARETKGFSHKRLRAMIDSSPLVGAGRVEDTFNLIGRALRSLITVASQEAGQREEKLVEELALSVASAKSVKAALDVDWRLPSARADALSALLEQFGRLMAWINSQFEAEAVEQPPLSDAIALVERFIAQDTEPDPDDPTSGKRRVKTGNGKRQVSVHDPDQRHGRKSKSKVFVGYKRHVAVDADVPGLVLAVHVKPANLREHDAAAPLLRNVEDMGMDVTDLHIDRGYLAANAVHERRHNGMKLVSKPPTPPRNRKRFGKADFDVDAQGGKVTCPAGHCVQVRQTVAGPTAAFPRQQCRSCALCSQCLPPSGQKKIVLHQFEALYQDMVRELATPEGRKDRRERVGVEHALARFGAVQGTKARYRGLTKNQFHAEVCAVVTNCHVLNRVLKAA